MDFKTIVEKNLRSRILWGMGFPLLLAFCTVLIQASAGKGDFGQNIPGIGWILFLAGWFITGWLFFLLLGLGLNLSGMSQIVVGILEVISIAGYVYFIVILKKVKLRTLYWLTLIVIIIGLLTIRGCLVVGNTPIHGGFG